MSALKKRYKIHDQTFTEADQQPQRSLKDKSHLTLLKLKYYLVNNTF